jgi:four helix bundle protein
MQNFRNLLVWQRAQDLAARVYGATQRLAGADARGPRSQLRRSASSIAANIAEGAVSTSPRQFARYLEMAIGSASETESHLDFMERIGRLHPSEARPLMSEAVQTRRMLIALRRRVLEGV